MNDIMGFKYDHDVGDDDDNDGMWHFREQLNDEAFFDVCCICLFCCQIQVKEE